jgi:hypothetical protein
MITYFVLWCYLLIQGMALNTGVLPFDKGRALHPNPHGRRQLTRLYPGNAHV